MRRTLVSWLFALFALVSATNHAAGQYAGTAIYLKSGPSTVIKPATGRVGFELPAERAGHSFTLYANTGMGRFNTTVGFITTSGSGAGATIRSLLFSAQLPSGTITSWWIKDNTAGQTTFPSSGVPTGTT